MNPNLPPLEEKEIDPKFFSRHNRRSFMTASVLGLLGIFGLRGILRMQEDRGIPWFLRQVGNLNDSFWKANFREDAKIATADPEKKTLRVNGDAGLEDEIDEKTWRLEVVDPGQEESLSISLAQIKALPSTEMSFDFKCIEGWSQKIQCRGVKVSDFMESFGVGQVVFSTMSGVQKRRYPYAALTSVNGGYYVSFDAESLWHPQTFLCYEINGEPLPADNGAPLRLMSALKYGVKNLKQLGRIEFVESTPPDYWAERGYLEGLIL